MLSFASKFAHQRLRSKEQGIKEEKKEKDELGAVLGSLKWRSIGPAWASGRIADFAVNPDNHSEYYVAVASGNVFKTINNGTTWKPVFDNYGAYSIGCVTMDPNNHNVIWVGTGENNHQRALGYGDGVYKSVDGGGSFENVGLKESRQIGDIIIDPRNSDIVFVAAEGSAWGPGGDRGLYKTTDGGKNWNKVLEISEHTGVNNVAMDPSNPDIMYATSEQRRRHVYSKIGGGPESAVYKSTDGGETWRKIMKGLPSVHIGGMGIDVSPVNPNVVYLIAEAAQGKGGFFRSTNKGESWEKMSDHSSSGQYYNEIYCDPKNVDRVFSVETFTHSTLDGGKTWKRLSTNNRHVDDHALWIDPDDTNHFIIGGDGGIYETWDNGGSFDFKENLPITQFYRVAVDNELPFYNIYGGTQDNNSMGGPSQTTCSKGIKNDDWFVTMGGDGFFAAIDPTDPNIVYTEYQYGNMYRYDKKSGETVKIKPLEGKDELAYKWNWNAPLILSKHNHKTLYTGANKLFKSTDRGNTWKTISEDLTSQADRNTWKVMDKYWSAEAVAKDVSTSQFGTIVSLCESPVKQGLLYVGTDDGVIQVTEDDGANWRKISEFPGVPPYTYVSDIFADRYDENVVYATFNNLKRDDFKPYVLKSTDKGKSWTSISNNLPENGSVHTIAQDNIKKDLLFAGTEFAAYVSIDGGQKWSKLKSGLPTISVMDIAIQERENDLVIATFGRGFYVIDNYSPLRDLNKELIEKEAHLFPIEDALVYAQTRARYNQGQTYYYAKNPKYGATFTYYLKEAPKTKQQNRREKEKELFKNGERIPQPTWRDLELEGLEETAHLIFTIKNSDGRIVRKINKKPSKGLNRINWDLRYTAYYPVSIKDKFNPTKTGSSGIMAVPGEYTVEMSLWDDGNIKQLAGPEKFVVKPLKNTTLPAANRKQMAEFIDKAAKLYGHIIATDDLTNELIKKTENIKQAIYYTPEASDELAAKARKLSNELEDIRYTLHGVEAKASWEEIPPAKIPIMRRAGNMMWVHYSSTTDVTQTVKDQYDILKEQVPEILKQLKTISEVKIPEIEKELNTLGAPWTPGRIPELK
eukprot:Anaeramoba_ignava/a610583_47.p1 GENE.a610583_47~~a610583_47.p1  ORF type:complete len:1085 (+),score=123.68 a610583_47:11-3265(+)